jgi:hypothetical protein
MVKITSLRIDPDRASKGVWFDWDHGVRFLIARIGNPNFDERLRELIEADQAAGKSAPEAQEAATIQAVAETLLLGWEGLDDDNGKPLKWTAKRSHELLADPALQDIYKFVVLKASETARFRAEADAEALGN